jgi:hypothetical protein
MFKLERPTLPGCTMVEGESWKNLFLQAQRLPVKKHPLWLWQAQRMIAIV